MVLLEKNWNLEIWTDWIQTSTVKDRICSMRDCNFGVSGYCRGGASESSTVDVGTGPDFFVDGFWRDVGKPAYMVSRESGEQSCAAGFLQVREILCGERQCRFELAKHPI